MGLPYVTISQVEKINKEESTKIKEELQQALANIPQNIDVASIPHVEADLDTLEPEQFELVKGKAWFSVYAQSILYPLYFEEGTGAAWVSFNSSAGVGDYYITIYVYDGESHEYYCEELNAYQPGTKLYEHTIRLKYEDGSITQDAALHVIALFSTVITNDNVDLLGGSSFDVGTYFNESIIKLKGSDVLEGAFNVCFDTLGDYFNIGFQKLSGTGISSLSWLSYDFVVLSDTVTEL